LHSVRRVWQQSHFPRALDRLGHVALVPSASTALARLLDPPAFINKTTQQLDVLVVNNGCAPLGTKPADLLLSIPTVPIASISAVSLFSHVYLFLSSISGWHG